MSEEIKEKKYLRTLLEKVRGSLQKINESIIDKKRDIDEMHHHMEEYKRDMDHLKKNALRETIFNYSAIGDHHLDKRKRLIRLLDVPYFGRIDFREESAAKADRVYVGVHNFQDEESGSNLVYDWRAPISSMFYDYETGDAGYKTEEREVRGEIVRKSQFRIRQGEMEYMLDSDITIQDDVLQRELNHTSSGKMKNIVATIQREQNAIIRNEDARHLIIQGVAGSGKTSIALHRIAFLLYKFKESISSEDILIISPNKVFASYISNVLPELGEETIDETSMEEIAERLFDYSVKFQTFFEQVSELLEKTDEKLIERIRFKSSPDMLKKMDEYVLHLENNRFTPADITIRRKIVPSWFVQESFQKYNRLPLLSRFNEVVRDIVENVFIYYKYEITGKERTALHTTVRKMFTSTSMRMLHKDFYQWLDRPEMLKTRKGSVYEYSDVYPLLYLKMKLEGLKPFTRVKHLVVDEMQDYSAVQYRIISKLYPCKKTILGDINQSVNPFSSSGIETIESLFPDATCMTMLKSYRSTYEITEFTKQISGKADVEAIERRGEEPRVMILKKEEEETTFIMELIKKFNSSCYKSMGIICKTQHQADKMYEVLKGEENLTLLNALSVVFGSGIVITTAHLAKGLEFDEVIVPFCTEKNYRTEPDRQMLYVACTRAMHRLNLTAAGSITTFIPNR
ncbi:MAG: AAA family ATPase [Proteiniphilum sp.]|nr:AAA family ATPase [Proteiniphilum sp.]